MPTNTTRALLLGSILLAACTDQERITGPEPEASPRFSEGAVLGQYNLPIAATNGWQEPGGGWEPTALVVPANTYVRIDVSGGVTYSFNEECRIAADPCSNELDGKTTGPLYDGGASRVRIAFERAGGGIGGAVPLYPVGGANPQDATASYRLVYFTEPKRIYFRRSITQGGSWNPILGSYTGFQYFLTSSQQMRLTEVPEPLTITGPTTLIPNQAGTYTADMGSGLTLRRPEGAGSGHIDLVTWEFFKGDTLPQESWSQIWRLTGCAGRTTCEFNPGPGISGRLRAFAWVEGVLVMRKSEVIRGVEEPHDLKVECKENGVPGRVGVVVRGGEINCTLTTLPEGGTIEVEKWWFTGQHSGGDYLFPTAEDSEETGGSWGGRMAISGTVHVRASVNGGAAQSKQHSITVEARNWSNQSVVHNVRRITSAEFNINAPENKKRPPMPAAEHHLGAFFGRAVILAGGDGVFDYIDDYGPNHFLTLYRRVPVELDLGVTVHPEMENQGEFFRRHPAVNGGSGRWCVQRDFPRYVQLILAHEGLPMNPYSHTGVYHREYEALAGPAVEDIVFPNDATEAMSDAAEDRLKAVNTQADATSDAVVDSPPHEVPFQCHFKWR